MQTFVLDNVRMWIEDYHLDGLRLNVMHTMFDFWPASHSPRCARHCGRRPTPGETLRAVFNFTGKPQPFAPLSAESWLLNSEADHPGNFAWGGWHLGPFRLGSLSPARRAEL